MNRLETESYLGVAEGYNPGFDDLIDILAQRIRKAIAVNDSQAYRDNTEAMTTILVAKRLMTRVQATVCTEEVGWSRSADGLTLDRLGTTVYNMANLMMATIGPGLDRHHDLLDHRLDAGRLLRS